MKEQRHNGNAVILLGSSGCAIEHNVLTGSSDAGVAVASQSRDTLIRHNIIVKNADVNLDIAPDADKTTLSYNNVWQPGTSPNYRGCKPGTGDISVAPRFRNEIFGDFTLHDESPCRNAGDPTVSDPDGSRPDLGVEGPPPLLPHGGGNSTRRLD
jgi:parallel beta-helix repeat protein